ncbi:MAG: hypothetical protein AUI04_11200 [Candidatus Rokubacteria bacterium 13_2_20CM_2_64_8]|nr:MAG: hypothetical protein AUI04_11200 [Candidatus Rokubacteria bacterium 13_2_20CM_2_64_8]OLC61376.1 MAG: hypothetical protein AUH76_10200 [Candidatus Rokubacteria bacterium 13_1_40CM_4_67_11]OLD97724.1 MAG: hypothetical protein AUG80_10345 [Candidatus Rokubacteria bacterium 13_1_20CM_4_68_9]
MGRGIDAAGEPADDRDTSGGEIEGKTLGHLESVGAGSTRTHDRDGEPVGGDDRAAHVNARW